MLNKILLAWSIISSIQIPNDIEKDIMKEKERINKIMSEYYGAYSNEIKDINLEKSNDQFLQKSEAVEFKLFHPNFMFMFANLDLGTSTNLLPTLIDTGSFDLFIDSKDCTNCNPKAPKLVCNEKYGCHVTDEDKQMSYGSGTVYGKYAFIDLYAENKKISEYKFLLVKSETAGMRNIPTAGLIGVGLRSQFNKKNFAQSLNKRYMRIEFDSYTNHKNLGTGKLSFTNLVNETSNQRGNFVKSLHNLFFMTKIDSTTYNGEQIEGDNKPYVLDTGTSLMLLSQELISGIKQKIESNDAKCMVYQSILLCLTAEGSSPNDVFKNVNIKLNGVDYTLTPNDYILGKQEKFGKEIYILRFGVSNMQIGILGLPFFQNLVSYHDYQNNGVLFFKKDQFIYNLLEDKDIPEPSYNYESRRNIIFYSIYSVIGSACIAVMVSLFRTYRY